RDGGGRGGRESFRSAIGRAEDVRRDGEGSRASGASQLVRRSTRPFARRYRGPGVARVCARAPWFIRSDPWLFRSGGSLLSRPVGGGASQARAAFALVRRLSHAGVSAPADRVPRAHRRNAGAVHRGAADTDV